MLTKLKHILNTYTDKELKDMELWVNSDFQIDKMIIDEYSIDLIQENSDIEIKTYKNYDTIICKEDN